MNRIYQGLLSLSTIPSSIPSSECKRFAVNEKKRLYYLEQTMKTIQEQIVLVFPKDKAMWLDRQTRCRILMVECQRIILAYESLYPSLNKTD